MIYSHYTSIEGLLIRAKKWIEKPTGVVQYIPLHTHIFTLYYVLAKPTVLSCLVNGFALALRSKYDERDLRMEVELSDCRLWAPTPLCEHPAGYGSC